MQTNVKNNFISAFLLFSLSAFGVFAQTDAPEAVSKAEKILVSIPVTVSDREGRYIANLKKDDFTVYQNGVEQKIDSIATFDEPIDIALLLDTSGSTKKSLTEIKNAARDFIELLNVNDRCSIMTFDAQLKTVSPLTNNRQSLEKSLEQVVTAEREGSIVLQAIDGAARNSFADSKNRKVIVVLSDGKDFGSAITKNELLTNLEEADVSIYAVFFQTGLGFNKLVVEPDGTIKEGKESKPKKAKPPKKKKFSILIPTRGDVYTEEDAKLLGKAADIGAINFLEELSELTAGRFYQSDAPNLSGIFKKIAGELRRQYRINFYSREIQTERSIPEITVKVRQTDAVVRRGGAFRAKQL